MFLFDFSQSKTTKIIVFPFSKNKNKHTIILNNCFSEPKLKSPTKPIKPIVRYVSRPPPPKEPTPPPPTPPPPTPPPPPPTPPPQYLIQFEGLPWFERHKNYIKEVSGKLEYGMEIFRVRISHRV